MRKATFGAIASARRRSSNPGQAMFDTWEAGVDAAGGTYTANSKAIALDLANQIASASYFSKIRYLLPLLGADLPAAQMPLVDVLAAGIATNYNFVGGDFSESTGLQGNGLTKRLDTLVTPVSLGTGDNGGMGYWETNAPALPSHQCGARDAVTGRLFRLYLDQVTPRVLCYWGNVAGSFQENAAVTNSHYYLQRDAATSRVLYKSAASVASSVVNDPTLSATCTFNVCAIDATFFGSGRCGLFYLTDGALSGAEVTAFNTLLTTFLITPTGR